jgi:hypothetical protein
VRTILGALLLAISLPAVAEWVEVAETDKVHVYLDPATIRKDGNLRKAWELQNLKQRDKSGYLSRRFLWEFDCKEERRRSLSFSIHSEPMAGGNVLGSESETDPWHHIAPGTIAADILKRVCSK